MGYTDYPHNIKNSSGGQMLIRVADSAGTAGVISANYVKFFVRPGSTATNVGSPGYPTRAYANGKWNALANIANWSNSTSFRELGQVLVTTNQTVTFHIDDTHTMGFGGPDDFAVLVTRATIPAAPDAPDTTDYGFQFFTQLASFNSTGGSPITEWQVGYGYSSTTVQFTKTGNLTTKLVTVDGLTVGAPVYTWHRVKNAVGWSPWSAKTTINLRRGCRVKKSGVWEHAIPYVKYSGAWKTAEPYIKTGKVPGVTNGTWQVAAYTG